MRLDFAKIVDHAMKNPAVSGLRPVVEKEILHYDILFALERGGLLKGITFQGGTSLRLCHGGSRFSEDLDFVGGRDFSAGRLKSMSDCIMDYIGKRYGLDITIKEPKEMKLDPNYFGVNTDRWQIAISTAPQRRNIPKQKIKLEVANVPAYTSQLMSPLRNYDLIPHGHADILIPTETLDEILADKIIALAACHDRVRNRDIWDIGWLKQRNATIMPELIESKILDYQIEDYQGKLRARIESIDGVTRLPEFSAEMSRFIALDAQKSSLMKEGFIPFLAREVSGVLKAAEADLYAPKHESEFSF